MEGYAGTVNGCSTPRESQIPAKINTSTTISPQYLGVGIHAFNKPFASKHTRYPLTQILRSMRTNIPSARNVLPRASSKMNFPKPKQSVLTSTSPLAWTGCALQTASVGLPLAVFASSEIFKKNSLKISPNSPCQVSRWTWIFSLFFFPFFYFWNDMF